MTFSIQERREQARKDRAAAANLTPAKAAKKVRTIAISHYLSNDDKASLEILANLLEENDDYAMDYVRNSFDTFLREQIPTTVWAYMGGRFVYDVE